MDISKLQTALGNYARVNSKEIHAMIYGVTSPIFDAARTITKVKGRFPAINSITTNVVQGFIAEWNEVGSTKIRPNELVAYHQKINFPIIPSEIEASWLGEMNEEDLDLASKSISQYIIKNELTPRAADDVRSLIVNGDYDANNLGTFGKSMNGLVKVIQLGVGDSDNPMYRIPLSGPFTESNMLDNVKLFETKIPKKLRRSIKAIFMSTTDADKYKIDFLNTYGTAVILKDTMGGDPNMLRSPIANIPIVGIDEWPENGNIWATVDGNLLKLIDRFNGPTITDIQKQDYKLKLFMEFHLGVGFWTNQLVFVGMPGGSSSGLISGESSLYFD